MNCCFAFYPCVFSSLGDRLPRLVKFHLCLTVFPRAFLLCQYVCFCSWFCSLVCLQYPVVGSCLSSACPLEFHCSTHLPLVRFFKLRIYCISQQKLTCVFAFEPSSKKKKMLKVCKKASSLSHWWWSDLALIITYPCKPISVGCLVIYNTRLHQHCPEGNNAY